MARPRKGQAILLKGNSELAQLHIDNVENVFINRINAISIAIGTLGIGVPTKDMICDIVFNGGEDVKALYMQKCGIDGNESLLSGILQEKANIQWEKVKETAKPFTESANTIYNGMRINNKNLFDWFDVDGNGCPYLTDTKKEEIIESVREYIITKQGVELHHLQQEIVERLQKMFDIMHDVAKSDGFDLSDGAKSVYVWNVKHLWEMKEVSEKNDDGEIVNIRYVFTPRRINFDPVTVDKNDNEESV